jgi:hypothetical protein
MGDDTFTVRLSLIDLVLAVAAGKQGAAESPPGSNAGPFPERVQKVTGNTKGDAWCASNVADTGSIACAAAGLKWPLPLTGSVPVLAEFAQKNGILVRTPQRGDLWLMWSESLKRFAHTGLVRSVSTDLRTIAVQAGNTVRPNAGGDVREGWLDWVRTETVGPKDAFVRWINLFHLTSSSETASP